MSGAPEVRRVWLVEDSALDAERARRALEGRYPVDLFPEAESMVERLEGGERPAALLLDVELPGMSGLETLRFVRERHDALELPVVILTSRSFTDSIVEALAAGANDHLSKPYQPAELLARVESVLRTQQLFVRMRAAERAEALSKRVMAIERERLESLLSQTSAAVCILRGPELVCDYANPAFLRLAQVDALVGRTARAGAPLLQNVPWVDAAEQALRTGEPSEAQAVPVRVAGGERGTEQLYFKITFHPSRGPSGEVVGVDVLGVDVTEQVAGRRKVEELLSLASHELKTPVTSLRLHVQSLLRRLGRSGGAMDAEHLRRSLETVERQVQRQLRLIDDLVDVSRLHASKLRLETEEVDVSGLAEEVVSRFRNEPDGRVTNIVLLTPGPTPAATDRFRLDQVITNLVSNAIKYGRGRPIHVEVEPTGTRRVRISVRDEGIGISPTDLDRVFDRFERAVSQSNYAGLGLGLWISRRIVEAMSGTISVDSRLGEGSKFTVEIPRTLAARS